MATRKKHTPEQVVRKLATVVRLLGDLQLTADVSDVLALVQHPISGWRNQFGGMNANDAKRLKDLERENATLKRLLADAELEKAAVHRAPASARPLSTG